MNHLTDTSELISTAELTLHTVRTMCGDIPINVFGSVAVALTCPKNRGLWNRVGREVRDIDLVTFPKFRVQIQDALRSSGFSEDPGNLLSNAQYGRLYFYKSGTLLSIELLTNPLIFHHRIDLKDGLSSKADTIPLADLVATKLQWENLAEDHAQLIDLCILFAEHQIVNSGEDGISAERLSFLVGRDWGLWTTITQNLKDLEGYAAATFSSQQDQELKSRIVNRISVLKASIIPPSKTTLWWKLQRLAHQIIPSLPVGYHVEELDDGDIWKTWRREGGENG